MASHAAMLLDPRAYKKQMQKNGNDLEFPPGSPYPDSDTRSEAQNESSPLPPSSRRCPSPPEDPMFFDDTDSLIDTADRPESGTSSQSNTRSPIAPPGTATAAQRFLAPQRRRQPSVKPSPRSRSRVQSLESHTSDSATSSPQLSENADPDVNFTFTSAQGDEDHDMKRGCDQLEADADMRHGNLIEDMYGVERRSNPPYKKIKAKEEEQDGLVKKGNFAITGDSGIGKWMKEDQPTPDTSFPVTPDVVDLTLDASATTTENDDLQVTGSKNLSIQRVCYGKIENARVQAISVPRPVAQSIFGDTDYSWPSMKLGVHHNANQENIRIDVSDPHGHIFGAVEARIAAVIVPLLDSPGLKVDLTARLDYRQRKPDEWPGQPCSEFYRASINLYGLRKDAELVGKHLGQNNVWLGTPFSVEQGVPVFNPHAEKRRAQANFLPSVAARGRSGVSYEIRTAEEVNDAVMKMFDQLQSAENLPEMEPPSSLKTPLLRHQKQALWFMTEKEKPRKFGPKEEDNNSLWRIEFTPKGEQRYREIISGITMAEEPPQTLGGLLADMMGLGKTLSILSLVVSSLEEARKWAPLPPPTEMVQGIPGIRNSKTTLLVCPLSAVNNWVLQIKDHLRNRAVSYYVFHGAGRTHNVEELSQYDLVITTYTIVLSELSGKGSKRRGVSPLMKMNMFRIVLDEAHTIREQSAAQTQAIFKLNSQRKWSVTGTPIQNRLEDLLSVTKFLGLFPYNDRSNFNMHILSRFKTGDATVLASLRVLVDSFTLRRVKDKIDIPARDDRIVSLRFSEKEKQLHDFFRNESNVMMRVIAGEDQAKMKGRMYHHILKAMMILRQISAHGKELLDAADRERIKGLSVQDAINLEEGGDNDTAEASDKKAYEMFVLMQESSADACAMCNQRLEQPNSDSDLIDRQTPIAVILPCYDLLCPNCFSGWKRVFDAQTRSELRDIKCQACDGWIPASYSSITVGGLEDHLVEQAKAKQNRRQSKVLGDYEGPHTKTTALVQHLQATAEQSRKLGYQQAPLKSVVFSSWTSHLDLIEIALKDNNITGFERLDGTMSLAARGKSLEEFHNNPQITVLLATIGAGGVGLNLTAASNVYIMEPQYNPAAVAQAVDRVHRIGQTREVTTVQFVMKDSIEEKIFELAKKKQQLADLSMNRGKLDKKEVQEQRMRDYRGLFK